jgi:hypothetical protein
MTLVSYIILGLILNLKIKASSLSSSGIRGYFGGGGGGWVFIVFKLRICDRLTFDFNVINISENYIEPLIV